MRSLLDELPLEIAKRIHPDWQKNEAEYWARRYTLLSQYAGRWIGFANGRVIASGTSPVEVFHAAQASGQHPFVTCVGHEHEPNRMRRASFSYDKTRSAAPLNCLARIAARLRFWKSRKVSVRRLAVSARVRYSRVYV